MRIFGQWWDDLIGRKKVNENAFNRAFFQYIGGQGATYDHKQSTYLNEGYGYNPDVFAIINQQVNKLISVPFDVHKIKDKSKHRELRQLEYATKGHMSVNQLVRSSVLKKQAFDDGLLEFPLEQPNPNQNWTDIWSLYVVFKQITGNCFMYVRSPEDGVNAGQPSQLYVLPSHLMKIVLKEDADLIVDENVIDYYMLIHGNQQITFDVKDIMHIKDPNPFFDFSGSHLYGLSRIRALLRNIESSNVALDNNIKTLKNSGVFGFISGKDKVLSADQAQQIKEQMQEMDRNSGRLSKIAGLSIPIEFTKLSLTTDELKPFDYLSHDQKTIANVLVWDVLLLNNKDSSSYNNLKTAQRNVVINAIVPMLMQLSDAFNKDFIPRFKGYEDAEIRWDYTELPEMQENVKDMIEAYSQAPITPNELRDLINMPESDIEGMDTVWIDGNKRRIDEQGLSDFELDQAFGID